MYQRQNGPHHLSRLASGALCVLVGLSVACDTSEPGVTGPPVAVEIPYPGPDPVEPYVISFNVSSFAYKTHNGEIIMPGGLAFHRGTEVDTIPTISKRDSLVVTRTDYFCVKPKSPGAVGGEGAGKCGIQSGGSDNAGVLDGFVQGGPRLIGMLPMNSTDHADIHDFPVGRKLFLAATPKAGCSLKRWRKNNPWYGPIISTAQSVTFTPGNGETYYAVVECVTEPGDDEPPSDDDPCIICNATFESKSATDMVPTELRIAD